MNWPFWSRRHPAASDLDTEMCDGIELSLYADGMAAPEESRRVAAHLATCADCRESLAWMQATHRALASRPIVAPPANLQARIAEAIAASSAAPIRLSPARAFTLRPAYAAVASLTVLGVALSVSLLHHPVPPAPTMRPVTPPIVAVNPTPTLKTTASHDHSIVAEGRPSFHATVHSLPVHQVVHPEERVAALPVPSTELPAAPFHKSVRDTQSELAVKPPAGSWQEHPKPSAALFASTHSGPAEPKSSLATPLIVAHKSTLSIPKPTPPILEATNLPKVLPSVPVSIGPATVTTTSRIQLASDGLDGVRDKAALLRTAGFTTIMKSASHVALNVQGFNVSDAHTYPISYGPLNK